MKVLFPLLFIVFCFQLVEGQTTRPTPNPRRTPTRADEQRNSVIPPNVLEKLDPSQIKLNDALLKASSLYRKPTKDELNQVKPDKLYFEQYGDFLKQKNTGILRLVLDFGCGEDESLVVASVECLKHGFPGGGSAFSFRTRNYSIWRLSDIGFRDGNVVSLGKLQQGIMVNIGDIPIEKVNINYPEVEFIENYKPLLDPVAAQKDFIRFKSGVLFGDKEYASLFKAEAKSTYILRSIAFRGNYFREINRAMYDEFEFDKRKDILVVFRIVSKESDGSIIILWKELRKTKAPKIELKKN